MTAADPTPAPRFTLRQLPLPAKLVVSAFLLAVGLGYTSAMVQLHMQHSEKDGAVLPTPGDVVAVFAGKVWKTKEEAEKGQGPSRLEQLVMGDPNGGFNGVNMAPAFFAQDDADYRKQAKDPARKPKLDEEREGERAALVAWVRAAPEARRAAYVGNEFALPKELAKRVVTAGYVVKDKPGMVLVRSLFKDRCVRCHQPGGEKGDIPLTTYEEVEKYLPAAVDVPPGGGWVDSGRQIGLVKLTQSTHAHLLSFAVLFGLTGLIFAFTGLPGIVRGVVGPLVLIAQFADVACWWLARLPDAGPYFAMAIIYTGAVTGAGLGAHIVLSLFGMYGSKGKLVLVVMFGAAAGGAGVLWQKVIDPYLKAEKAAVVARAAAANEKDNAAKKAPEVKQPDDGGKGKAVPPAATPNGLERVLAGAWKTDAWAKDGKVPDGGMVRAFFDKEGDFKAMLKDDPAEAEKLVPQRQGERDALLAWAKAAADARKKAYDDNAFPLPEALVGKPTKDFTEMDGKQLKVKDLIEARCASCHAADNKVPLDSYESLSRYFGGPAAAGGVAIPVAKD